MKFTRLLRSQSNLIFLKLKEAGFNLSEFNWETFEIDGKTGPRLVHKPTGYFIHFSLKPTDYFVSYRVTYSPGDHHSIVNSNSLLPSWEPNLFSWIDNLKEELETPDLWEELRKESTITDATNIPNELNLQFLPDEITRIRISVEGIYEHLIQTQQLNEAQNKYVKQRLDYLVDSSNRMGKKDWLNLGLGVLVSIILYLSLPPDAAGELMRIAGTLLNWLTQNLLTS